MFEYINTYLSLTDRVLLYYVVPCLVSSLLYMNLWRIEWEGENTYLKDLKALDTEEWAIIWVLSLIFMASIPIIALYVIAEYVIENKILFEDITFFEFIFKKDRNKSLKYSTARNISVNKSKIRVFLEGEVRIREIHRPGKKPRWTIEVLTEEGLEKYSSRMRFFARWKFLRGILR